MKNRIAPLVVLLCIPLYSCGGDDDGGDQKKKVEVPDVQVVCESIAPVNMDDADIVLSGADCSEEGLRNAIEQGG